jgi:hypothetical protein
VSYMVTVPRENHDPSAIFEYCRSAPTLTLSESRQTAPGHKVVNPLLGSSDGR